MKMEQPDNSEVEKFEGDLRAEDTQNNMSPEERKKQVDEVEEYRKKMEEGQDAA